MRAPGIIRRLGPVERHPIRDHLLRLDSDDRLLRFGAHVSDARIEDHCEGLDWRRAVVVGHLVDGKVRGLGQLLPLVNGQPRAAEAALSVERPYQNRGVGTELLRRLITTARNRSIEMLFMLCLLENGKVRRMARRLGATLAVDRGEVKARLPLAWPNHLTVLLELLDEAEALLAVLRPAGSVPADCEGAPRHTGAGSVGENAGLVGPQRKARGGPTVN